MKTFKCSLVLRTRENTDVFTTLDDNIYGIHSKRVNILYVLQALLRQKIQEIKRLELALQNEQHLRSELELDLEERGNMMKDKGKISFLCLMTCVAVQ